MMNFVHTDLCILVLFFYFYRREECVVYKGYSQATEYIKNRVM